MRLSSNATELYYAMHSAIADSPLHRAPVGIVQAKATHEVVGAAFCLKDIAHNVVTGTDPKWMLANLLHFFWATEEAAPLLQFPGATRFLTGDQWVGAYGYVAVPQLVKLIALLQHEPASRRAILQMQVEPYDMNRPHCWNVLHFLTVGDRLDLLVYQRSLNLDVMPYDCVILTNCLNFVAKMTGIPAGRLHWFLGSLHSVRDTTYEVGQRNESMYLDSYDRGSCFERLKHL